MNNTIDGLNDGFKISSLIISILITIFGLFGNSVVIFVISTLKEYKKSITHWYVLQLAVADTIFLLSLPFNASQSWTGMWIFSEWMCKIKEAVLYLNCYASIFFLMVMSIDRYVAVCWSHSSIVDKLRSRKFVFCATAVIWIVCLLFCIPLLLYSYKIGVEPNCICSYDFPKTHDPELCKDKFKNEALYQICLSSRETTIKRCSSSDPETSHTEEISTKPVPDWNNSILTSGEFDLFDPKFLINYSINFTEIIKDESGDDNSLNDDSFITTNCHYSKQSHYLFTFLYFNFFAMFVVPFLIMVVCYGLIVKRIFTARVHTNTPVSASFTQTTASTRSSRNTPYTRADKDRLRVTIMCAALVTSFVVCWLPHHAVHLAKMAGIKTTRTWFCQNIQVIVTLFAYLNSALNPYLYSFLGKQFFPRLSSACSSLGKLFGRKRMSSTGSTIGLKQRNSRSKGGSSSNKTQTTKFQRSKLSSKNTGSLSQQNAEEVNHHDTRWFLSETQNQHSSNVEIELKTVAPSAENHKESSSTFQII